MYLSFSLEDAESVASRFTGFRETVYLMERTSEAILLE